MSLKDRLKGKLPENLLENLPEGYEELGDIAILKLPPKLGRYGAVIAAALCGQRKNINTVLNRRTMITGEKRIPGFEILFGSRTETVHREYGYRYHVDLSKMFFNGHLSYERQRIRLMIKPGEEIIVPFAGAGPFAVPAAASGASVIAMDINPCACTFCMENARLNGVQENLHVICADALSIPLTGSCCFDRAIVPAPYGMDEILPAISSTVKKGGMIHIYTFKKAGEIEDLSRKYVDHGLEVLLCRRCGNVAPGVSRYVFDLKKSFS